jgi:hypothetical protein
MTDNVIEYLLRCFIKFFRLNRQYAMSMFFEEEYIRKDYLNKMYQYNILVAYTFTDSTEETDQMLLLLNNRTQMVKDYIDCISTTGLRPAVQLVHDNSLCIAEIIAKKSNNIETKYNLASLFDKIYYTQRDCMCSILEGRFVRSIESFDNVINLVEKLCSLIVVECL